MLVYRYVVSPKKDTILLSSIRKNLCNTHVQKSAVIDRHDYCAL